MYGRYFGLKQLPFSIAPDPRYLFMSERHREALAHLLYGVRGGGGGFVVLTGDIGAGKTTVCRCLLEQLPARCNVAYIFNPKLTVDELLRAICAEFRVPQPLPDHPGVATVKDHVDALNEFLLRTHAVSQNNVLIIDEAQNLAPDVLEQLRLLTNLETSERKLLQIVLIGQPELRQLLARPEMQQLAQRVIARYHLEALSEQETDKYVRHRLTVAGLSRGVPFDAKSMRRIYRHSHGVPRRINLLCDRALLGAYAKGKTAVDARIVDDAAREVFDTGLPGPAGAVRRFERPALVGAGVLAGVVLVGGLTFALGRGAGVDAPLRATPVSGAITVGAGGTPAEGAAAADGRGAPPVAVSSDGAAEAAGTKPAAADSSPAPAGDPPANGSPASAPSNGTVVATVARTEAAASFDLRRGFAGLVGPDRDAWRDLAAGWNLTGDGEPCALAPKQQVWCWRTAEATLALIRQLDRPGVITLRDAANRSAHVVLTGLGPDSATLRIGGSARTVPLVALADYWRGEYATLWKVPPSYAGTIVDSRSGASARWLALQLATVRGDTDPVMSRFDDAALRGWIRTFQLTQGLPADGVAGPITLMHLNRAVGIDEPRLLAGK